MPSIKLNNTLLYIPYYQMLYKNDIIKINDGRFGIVEDVFYYENGQGKMSFSIKCFNNIDQYQPFNSFVYLKKRPFINWGKYLMAVTFKKYIK